MKPTDRAPNPPATAAGAADPGPPLADRLAVAASETSFLHDLLIKLSPSEQEIDVIKETTLAELAVFRSAHAELAEPEAREAFAAELVRRATKKAALAGAAFSLPVVLPVVGPIVSTAARLGVQFAFDTRLQVDLVIALAALYGYPWDKKELITVAFILVQLADGKDLGKYALKTGVQITVKQLVLRMIEYVSVDFGGRAVSHIVQPRIPFFGGVLRYGANLGIGALYSYQSTRSLGRRARYFFAGGEAA